MSKLCLYAVLCFFCSSQMIGQDHLSDQFGLAEDLFYDGRYFDASTEFKRLLFFDSLYEYRQETEYYLGVCYKKGGFYSEAIEHLSKAEIYSADPEFLFRVRIELIKCNILRRTIQKALKDMSILEQGVKDQDKINELKILKGFAYSFAGEWEKSSEYFRAAGLNAIADSIDTIADNAYSVSKAKILSAIVPGAGQIYTGNHLNGIVSLGLNALTLYLTINAFASERIFDGIMTGNFLWYRFYSGNIQNAAEFARQNNRKLENQAMKILQKFEDYRLD